MEALTFRGQYLKYPEALLKSSKDHTNVDLSTISIVGCGLNAIRLQLPVIKSCYIVYQSYPPAGEVWG